MHSQLRNGSLAQLNRALDYGSRGCRFESCTSHEKAGLPAFFVVVSLHQTAQYISPKINFTIEEVVLLDSVQKKKPIGDKTITKLRKLKLIEGRKPNVFISQRIAGITHQEAEYTDMKGLDDKYYQDLIIEALTQHGKLKRANIDKLLLNKLPSILNESQKSNKIDNLLRRLRATGRIAVGQQKYWQLVERYGQ